MRNMRMKNSLSKNNRIEDLSSITIFKRIILFVGLFVAAFLLYHRDTLVGYWKFRVLCKKSGGIKIHEPMKGNSGWMLAKIHDSKEKPVTLPFFFRQGFIRYKDRNGNEFDAIEVLPPPPRGFFIKKYYPYIIKTADKTKIVSYMHDFVYDREIPSSVRIAKYQELIIDLRREKTVASYTKFIFSWIKQGQISPFYSGMRESCKNVPSRDVFFTVVNKSME